MSEHPTEPGFYWARIGPNWEPVQLTTKRCPGGDVYVLQDHRAYDPRELREWGPRIERPDDRLPDETCPLCGSRDFEQWTIGHLVSDGRDPNRRSCHQCPCQWFVDGVVGGARVVRIVRR